MSNDGRHTNRSSRVTRWSIALALGGVVTAALLLPFLLRDGSSSTEPAVSSDVEPAVGESTETSNAASPEFVQLSLEPGEANRVTSAVVSASELRRDRGADEIIPTEDGLLQAIDLLETSLASQGFDGRVTVFTGSFISYRGLAHTFSKLLDDDNYRVDVEVHPNPTGYFELNAKLELALYLENVEEDLGPDTPRGSVWLSETAAYGHNAGADPDEWAAFDLGDEMIIVRVSHRGDVTHLLGLETFVKIAAETAESMRSTGLSRSASGDHRAFRDNADLGEMLSVALQTRCAGAFCGQIETPVSE